MCLPVISYFERFCIVRDNLVGTLVSARKPLPLDKREVNFYEFVIFLYLQLIKQPSFGHVFAKGIRWPGSAEPYVAGEPVAPTPRTSRDHRDGSGVMSARRAVHKKRGIVEGVSPRTVHPVVPSKESDSTSPQGPSSPASPSSAPSASAPALSAPVSTSSPGRQRTQAPGTQKKEGSTSPPPRLASKPNVAPATSEKRHSATLLAPPTLLTQPNTPKVHAEAPRNRYSCSASVSLSEQLAFITEHLGYILRLLCADDPSCNVRRGELEPLNFLFVVGFSNYVVHELNLIDVLPKAATTERYSRLDLAEWILHKLKINTHLYSLNPAETKQEQLDAATAIFPPKNIVKRPITVVGVHQQTILRADPEAIPSRSGGDEKPLSDESVDGRFARILNCNSSYIYMLCPISCMKVQQCVESIIVVGAVGSLICVENCKDTTIIVACKTIQISNCENCTFYLQTSNQPLVLGNNYDLRFGPYCTHYRSLDRHVAETGLDTSRNLWNQPLLFIVELLKDYQPAVIPVGGSRHMLRSAITKIEKQTYSLVSPDNFSPFRVPFELHGSTKQNPFPLPSDYQLALEDHTEEAILLKKELDRLIQEKRLQLHVQTMVRGQFEKWLAETGAMQQIEDLVKLQIQ